MGSSDDTGCRPLLDIWVMYLSTSKSSVTNSPRSLLPFIITATYRALTVHKQVRSLVPRSPATVPLTLRYCDPRSRREEAEARRGWAACPERQPSQSRSSALGATGITSSRLRGSWPPKAHVSHHLWGWRFVLPLLLKSAPSLALEREKTAEVTLCDF